MRPPAWPPHTCPSPAGTRAHLPQDQGMEPQLLCLPMGLPAVTLGGRPLHLMAHSPSEGRPGTHACHPICRLSECPGVSPSR